MQATGLPSSDDALPALDDRLVMPESRAEIVRGRLVMTPPADFPHAAIHVQIAYVLRAHAQDGLDVVIDMLTRTSRESDFAPDVSVVERDPITRKPRIAEVSIEVVSAQSLSIATDKARELSSRGTRRAFCVIVAKAELREWRPEADRWSEPLDREGVIEDRCFVRPIPVAALLDARRADESVVAALDARGEPALRPIEARGRAAAEARGRAAGEAIGEAAGELVGLRRGVLDLCEVLGVPVDPERHRTLDAMDRDALLGLAHELKRARSWPG